jgi:organic hydroperoxide reductase OsmC/OhrA
VSEARGLELGSVRLTVTAEYEQQGSILAGTARHGLGGIETRLEIESIAPRSAVAALVDQAERMCFVMDAVQRPHSVQRSVHLNGEHLPPPPAQVYG